MIDTELIVKLEWNTFSVWKNDTDEPRSFHIDLVEDRTMSFTNNFAWYYYTQMYPIVYMSDNAISQLLLNNKFYFFTMYDWVRDIKLGKIW